MGTNGYTGGYVPTQSTGMCPTCGHCPTCGRRYGFYPTYTYTVNC